jgi:lysophospholipase L1-like esterase
MRTVGPDRRGAGRWLGALGLTLGAVVVALAALEIFARLFLADGTNFDLEMWRYAKDLKRESPLPGVGHEHIPNGDGVYMAVEIKTNAHKLRDFDYDFAKPAGIRRIVMLGDSLMLGWGAPFEDSTPKRLEKVLNAGLPQPRFQVINAGVGNYNSAMEVAYFLGEGYRYQPDIVVLNYFINDAEPTPTRKRNLILERSYAAVIAAGALDRLDRMLGDRPDWRAYYAGLYGDGLAGWTKAKEAIATLASYCRNHGIRLLLASYPELHQLDPYPFAGVTAQVASQAAATGTPFVDLLPAVADVANPESLWVAHTDAHPNGLAARRYANLLKQSLDSDFPEIMKP